MLLPFQGATALTRDTQGVASLALGYVLHWASSPLLLNPKLQSFKQWWKNNLTILWSKELFLGMPKLQTLISFAEKHYYQLAWQFFPYIC